MSRSAISPRAWLGIGSIALSAFLFYAATFFVHMGEEISPTSPVYYLAGRLWLGYLLIVAWLRFSVKEKNAHPPGGKKSWLYHRAIWNIIAVLFFYMGVSYGSVTGANILNMTYPAFVALLSIMLLDEKVKAAGWAGVLLALVGAWFALQKEDGGFIRGDFFGLLSAVTAAVALVYLRKCRQGAYSTEMILLYVFKIGFWATLGPVVYLLWSSSPAEIERGALYCIAGSAIVGVGGQVALTYGYRYVTALQGSILSATRIIIALVAGALLLSHEVNFSNISGAALIFGANVILAYRKKQESGASVRQESGAA